VYSTINIGGLAVGMAASVLILVWVQHEQSYDAYHPYGDRTYRIISDWNIEGQRQPTPSSTAPMATFALKEIPEIKHAVRTMGWDGRLFAVDDKVFSEPHTALVDPSYFQVFDYQFLKGDPATALSNNRSVVLTQSVAQKYFGNQNALGKSIRIDNWQNFIITGVVKDPPSNTHLHYDCFFSFQLMKEYGSDPDNDWGNYNYSTYLMLADNASVKAVENKLIALNKKHHAESNDIYTLQPLKSIHLDYNLDGKPETQTLNIFSIVAFVILLIACINYVNLSTARATKRAKEVGIRKIVGANQAQLFGQFLGESVIVFGLAMVLALGLIRLSIPLYGEIAGKQLVLDLFNPELLSLLGATILVTLFVAGIYPALLLSSFQPLKVMKGVFILGGGNASFRKLLVVTQFAFSIMLVIGTLVIGRQLQYIQQKNLGFDRENVFTVNMRGDIYKQVESAKTEMLRQPGVKGVTVASMNVLSVFSSSTGEWEGQTPKKTLQMHQLSVDPDFLSMFNMEILEGRGFTIAKADSNAYVLNEEAIRQMGLKDPIGKSFTFHDVKGPIIGVVKNFHFKSVREKIEPFVFFNMPGWRSVIYVKTTGQEARQALAGVEKVWKQFNPAYPFEYAFMDETFERMYKGEQRIGVLFNAFAFVAILISCLGLFGLATYTAETRTKEIGIRKVLGANVGNIVALLSKEFVKLVLIANVIAWPLAWWVMHRWLEDFAYRIDLSWQVFVLAGVAALLIALITVSYQALKAALANPVKSLRTE
jgi:putative ABC transport system permease protein